MKSQHGKLILLAMLICCAAYCLPQFAGVFINVDSSPSDGLDLGETKNNVVQPGSYFSQNFLTFTLILAFISMASLFIFDWVSPFDKKLREAASSKWWLIAGGGTVFITGLSLVFWMPSWNDELSNIEAARYLWGNGLFEYFENYSEINKWLGSHHPPLLVLMYGLWYKLTGFSLIAGRLFNLVFALGATGLAYLWIRKMTDHAIAGVAALVLIITPMWCFSSASALLDMPFTLFFIASMFFFEKYIQRESSVDAILAGAFAAATILSRYNGLFLFPMWAVMLLAHKETRHLLLKKKSWLIAAVPVVLAVPWIIMAIAKGTFLVQVSRLSTFMLVGFVRPGGWWYLSEVLLPLFPIMMGIYTVPLFFYGLFSCGKIESSGIKRLTWGAMTYLVLLALTLPSPRYVLPVIPMLSAIYAVAFWQLAASQKGMLVILVASVLFSASFIIFYTWATASRYLYVFY